MSDLYALLFLVCFALFAVWRLLRYLHIFQQEEYDAPRFLRWLVATRALDKRLSLVIAAVAAILWALGASIPLSTGGLLLAGVFALFAVFENDPRKVAKKKLVMTSRAARIYMIALVFCIGVGAVVAAGSLWLSILAVQFIPFSLAIANLILKPFEAHIQRRIMRQASEKLAQVNPTVIGITGSFGKTSVKHILGHILEMNAPTLYTPGSVNTLMGISRVIREKLRAGTRYFLVEMGAYGKGSIKRLCALTPPHVGIITSLGEAHYERFKTLDTVARAKFELAEAVLRHAEGRLVIHEDVLRQPYAQQFVAQHPGKFLICGSGGQAALKITETAQNAAGMTVSVEWQGQGYELFAPLYGAAHAGNMALAFAASLGCGVAPERAVAALRSVPQITHRLEVKPQADGTIYIDDAFNSNPQGFAAALDLLALLAAEKGGRRILITPGIIELGDKHDAAHRELGAKAAQTADIALVVRGDRIPSFVEAFRAQAPQKPLHLVANLAEALQWLKQNAEKGDIYLIENDLPDLGEAKLVL